MRTLFLIALVALGPTVLEPLMGPLAEVCAQPCPDDDAQGQCAPDCADCTCCGHAAPSLAALPPTGGLSFVVQQHRVHTLPLPPEDPEARGLRHVPKGDLTS